MTHCQLVFLSATLPPVEKDKLMHHLSLQDAIVLSSSHTQRPEIAYVFETIAGDLLDRRVMDLMVHYEAEMTPGMVAILFVQRKRDVERLAQLYRQRGHQLPYRYYSNMEGKESEFSGWFKGEASPWVIATSGLYHGVDHPSVYTAIFAGLPDNVIEFAQACGRVSRRLLRGYAHVLVTSHIQDNVLSEMVGPRLENICRRVPLSKILDGRATSCCDLPLVALCDNCKVQLVSSSSFPVGRDCLLFGL